KILALAVAHKFSEALAAAQQAESALIKEPQMAHTASRVASIAGDYESAYRWLRIRVQSMPPFNVSDCRQDPDFHGLRKAKPNEFQDLLTPRCELKWTNCLLLADLTLSNRSVFPLSKVRIACRVGGRDFHQACDL